MYGIPNSADAAFAAQARVDSGDLAIMAAGAQCSGVEDGCAVTAQGTPDMTLAVAAGRVAVLGVGVAVSAGNVTITTAHATLPRQDLVVVSSAGVKSVTAGTAAAAPVFPAIPADSVVLAAIYVPAADTAIGSTQITDKRWQVFTTREVYLTSDVTLTAADTFYDVVSLSLEPGRYLLSGQVAAHEGTIGAWTTAKVWDGTTTYGGAESYQVDIDGAGTTIPIAPIIVTLTTTTTVKISAASGATGNRIESDVLVNGTGLTDKATKLVAQRIA